MANQFDPTLASEGNLTDLVVGDFAQWKRSDLVGDYPSSSYSAEYVARISGGGSNEIKISGVGSDTHYLFTISSSDSSAYTAGKYHWQLDITQTSSSNRIVVDFGDFTVIPDMDNNQADPRIHAEIMVDKIETILAGKADSDVASYSIAGRSLTKLSFQELLDARDHYKLEIVSHTNKELLRQGKSGGSTIKVRF
jgi:hypothetical protein